MFAQIEATSPNINPGFYTRYGSLQAAPYFILGTEALSVIWCNQSFPGSILKSDNSDYQDHYTFLFFSPPEFPAAIRPLFQQRAIRNSKVEGESPLGNSYSNTSWRFTTFPVLIRSAWILKKNALKLNAFKRNEFRLCGWLPRKQPNSRWKRILGFFEPNIWHPVAGWLTTKGLRRSGTAGRTCLNCVTDGEHGRTACASLLCGGGVASRTYWVVASCYRLLGLHCLITHAEWIRIGGVNWRQTNESRQGWTCY